MHDETTLTLKRLKRMLRDKLRPAVYRSALQVQIERWDHPDSERAAHLPELPAALRSGTLPTFAPAQVGSPWGPPWGTSWFRFTATVPAEWPPLPVEAVIDLGFGSEQPGMAAEGQVIWPDGTPGKALNPDNRWIRISEAAVAGASVEFFVEAAANPEIAKPVSVLGDPRTAGSDPLYTLARADLALFDEEVWDLINDLEVMSELATELSPALPRRWELFHAIDAALDALDLHDIAGSAHAVREVLAPALAVRASTSVHHISAIGHAHIDSAFLWPLRETVRKVSRTAANVCELMDRFPRLQYAMSQAQQFDWLRQHRPEIYERVRDKVATGQFVPVGGMWVEADTNMPGSEAMARQLVLGKRFFAEEFGIDTQEVWLPDSFGYSAALPQLVRLSGSRWFMTQKISWSTTNQFPHHTFWWEGIDGTRVFTHLPPVDTYGARVRGRELAHAVRNFREKGPATRSLMPFGHGDGGGGPTREMLARAQRLEDLDGSARVTIEPPAQFFADAEAEYPDAPVWAGELYLEMHRGTYTSQAEMKRGNRRSEHLLREAELWATTATVRTGAAYPTADLDRIWKTVLLHQFHDILPGSSIAWVHQQARETYDEISAELEGLITQAQRALAGQGTRPIIFNATSHALDAPAGGAAIANAQSDAVEVAELDSGWELQNAQLRVVVDRRGLITSIVHRAQDREVVPPGEVANLLQLHPDLPADWDAWDIDPYYRHHVTDLTEADELRVEYAAPDRATIRAQRFYGDSSLVQRITLRAASGHVDLQTSVDWYERETLLKLTFPCDLRADYSSAETQFGHLRRPTHVNTTWDAAKFELCAHRYVHVAEADWGVAIVNDATYGHDVTRQVRDDGATTTTVRASLLRGPGFPDPDADRGHHEFRHAVVPGADILTAVQAGQRLNLPQREITADHGAEPLFSVSSPEVVLETVKLAEDDSEDVITRLYEATGGRRRGWITPHFAVEHVTEVDLLERDQRERVLGTDGVALDLRPFQILTLRFRRPQ